MKPSIPAWLAAALLLAAAMLLPPAAQAEPPTVQQMAVRTIDEDLCEPLGAPDETSGDKVRSHDHKINYAISISDSYSVKFATPILASRKINRLIISGPAQEIQQLKTACILGYFEADPSPEGENDSGSAVAKPNRLHSRPVPIRINELLAVKGSADNPNAEGHIELLFTAPKIGQIFPTFESRFWRFWEQDKAIQLKLVGLPQSNNQLDWSNPYFGRVLEVKISPMVERTTGAWMFAIAIYLMGGLAIFLRKREPGWARRSGFRSFLHSISPWCLAGASGKASLSQLQMTAFSIMIATLLFYQWLRTGVLESISTDLLYLIGISTVGAGASQVTTGIKQGLEPATYAYAQRLGWFTAPRMPGHSAARMSQLLMSNNRFDIYKFQMLTFSIIIGGHVIYSGASNLAQVSISQTLLTLMGISQGAYVGGQAAANEVKQLQDLLNGMQVCETEYARKPDLSDGEKRALEERFHEAAVQAAESFAAIFDRNVPEKMLAMPNRLSAPAEQTVAAQDN